MAFGGPVRLTATGLGCGWPGRPAAVRGLDLDLSPGRTVAVVGPSGIGKTTLLLTLAGLLPPASGSITLTTGEGPVGEGPVGEGPVGESPLHKGPVGEGPVGESSAGTPGAATDLAALDPARLRATVSYTAEDAHVFTTTVRENLRVAAPGSPDAPLVEALHRAGLGDWLAHLPRGLDTMLGTGGTGLSGGERRRLLLARALLVGAPVLLLDEPAEHLDPQTADRLVADLLRAGPAVVLVTHRLAALAAADEVLVLGRTADGTAAEVTARGSHDDLLLQHAPYREALLAETGTVAV